MSTPFSKSKEKRPRSSSEFNKSFVKNVTSRVSGLLPATITKWFSSPSSSNTNGSAQVADATDSSTEDEAPESPITIQPPAKRTRYSSPDYHQLDPVETRCISTNTDSTDEPYTLHLPIGRSNIRRENVFMSTRVNSANDDTNNQTIQDTSFFKSSIALSSIDHSTSKKRKSLFGTPQEHSYISKPNSVKSENVRDPYFKPSLLSSPFYVGRTMYGGASSSYTNSPSIKRKISLTNETTNDDSVTMSHSARRVMDLLEHYSSPLIEAKRIPQITRSSEKYDPNNSSQQCVNPYNPKVYSYKTQELYVPSVASILTIKRKSRLMDSTNAARQIIASHSSSSEFLPYTKPNSEKNTSDAVQGDKLITKLKPRLTRTNREPNTEIESNTSDTVNLPNVVLQIDKDNLPKFTFGPTSQPSQSSSIQTPVIITPEALKRTTKCMTSHETLKKTTETDKSDKLKDAETNKSIQVNNNNDYYKFSRPVQISNEANKTSQILPKFSFGIPESNIEIVPKDKSKDDQLTLNVSKQIIPDKKLNSLEWKCSECWVMNKTDVNKCVCCGSTKHVEVDAVSQKCVICNVSINQLQCDKCTECEKKTANINKPFEVNQSNSTKWKCNDCWVENKESDEKCVCCGGKNPKINTPVTPISSVEKIVESEWKCNDCWIKNKSSLTKCAACGGLKPGCQPISSNFGNNSLSINSQTASKIKEPLDSTFQNITKSQSERWQCSICLVRNDSNRVTCSCCEATKPGIEKESHAKFNFHPPSEITFKFGIQPQTLETNTEIESEESVMVAESETNNNILPKTPAPIFSLRVKNFANQSELFMDNKPAETEKLNFTFGVQNEAQSAPGRYPIFDIPSKLIKSGNNDTGEKPQEVVQDITPIQKGEPLKRNLSLFNTPVISLGASDKPAPVPLQSVNQMSAVTKDTSFLTTSVVPTTTSEAKTQSNNFTFSANLPSNNLFATVPTTTTTISSILPATISMSIPPTSTVSLFQNANVATTTTASFFQKSDIVPSVGIPMFSSTESTTTTTSSVSMGIMPPVFSFGGQGSLPLPEKPKFNFNFTNNKTEPAPIFKPAFGVSGDSNISTNKFNLPSNSIVSGNSISGNSLNSTTQMNSNNALTTGNSLTTSSAPSIFGATVQKENMWSASTNNIFATNTTTNEVQKPPTFTFGTSTSFTANNTAFGSTTQQTQPPQQAQPTQQVQPPQPAPNVFGIAGQTTTSQPCMFGNRLQSQTTQNLFGNLPAPSNNPMSIGMFGGLNPIAPPTFGTLNPPIPTFEASPVPAPGSFTFGAAPSTGIFGFGQQPGQAPPQAEQPQQAGIYSFGAPVSTTPQMQFNIGSAPNANTAGRRVRKAMRRTQR